MQRIMRRTDTEKGDVKDKMTVLANPSCLGRIMVYKKKGDEFGFEYVWVEIPAMNPN